MQGRRRLRGVQAGIYLVLLASTAIGQMNGFPNGSSIAPHGVPASVTSFGFGGHPGFHGVPASVTSLGFGRGPLGASPPPFGFQHHHHRFSPFFGGAYYIPYPYPVYDIDNGIDESAEENDRRGPTVFDRRGEPSRYGERGRETEDYRAELSSKGGNLPEPAEATEQPSTLLVFKDGHQLEVSNYAIVGPTLYDLGGGRTRKIQLAELDLAATVKENDERGVQFELPRTTKPN